MQMSAIFVGKCFMFVEIEQPLNVKRAIDSITFVLIRILS